MPRRSDSYKRITDPETRRKIAAMLRSDCTNKMIRLRLGHVDDREIAEIAREADVRRPRGRARFAAGPT